mmetsp:Transcript_38632/g.93387  ORF Transcript_38632/g.93387 Transcript_38632/m.93387 type:complete len:340 (-) Transcript_38632:109-1128(-)
MFPATNVAILVLALLLIIIRSVDGNACDDAFAVIKDRSGPCNVWGEGTCPSECVSAFDQVHAACQGQTYKEDSYPQEYVLGSIPDELRFYGSDECKQAAFDYVMEKASTCQDWKDIKDETDQWYCVIDYMDGGGVIGECSDWCKSTIDGVLANCDDAGDHLLALDFSEPPECKLYEVERLIPMAESCSDWKLLDQSTSSDPLVFPVYPICNAANNTECTQVCSDIINGTAAACGVSALQPSHFKHPDCPSPVIAPSPPPTASESVAPSATPSLQPSNAPSLAPLPTVASSPPPTPRPTPEPTPEPTPGPPSRSGAAVTKTVTGTFLVSSLVSSFLYLYF